MNVYRCSCGNVELFQERDPKPCSRCPKCSSQIVEGGVKAPPALNHGIRAGVCIHCNRPVETLRQVVQDPSRFTFES